MGFALFIRNGILQENIMAILVKMMAKVDEGLDFRNLVKKYQVLLKNINHVLS